MKNFLLIFTGFLIAIALAGLAIIYVKVTMPDDIWSHQNRNILYESVSPDNRFKIGAYNYDSGALGYTSVQVSIAEVKDQYPLSGNLLRDQYIESVVWVSNKRAEFPLRLKNNLNAKLIVTTE
jgi:hypothetical protein